MREWGDEMIATLTKESFEPHLNTGFAISVDGHDETLTLVEIEERGSGMPGGRAPFILTFNGARTDARFNQNMMTLVHPEMGELEIFVAPITQNPDGTFSYAATFN